MNKTWILVAAFVLVAGLAFAAGYFFPHQASQPGFISGEMTGPTGGDGQFPAQNGEGQFPAQDSGERGGQGPQVGERISGEISAIDASSLTIENSSGSMTFTLTETTRFSQVGVYAGFQVGDFVQVSYQSAEGGDVALSVDTFAQN